MPKQRPKKAMVAISGGVDSSVSACLLKKAGYEVIGVFMKLAGNQNESERSARAVAKHLDIKFYPVNLHDKFKTEVIDYFMQSYQSGKTPNPCVRCNRMIKFGEMMRVADELGVDLLATGHYARINPAEKEYELLRGVDSNKDQSYFLYNLAQEKLKKIIFPLGGMKKEEIKKIAKENNIPHLKGESQDVCFLGKEGQEVEHNEFLKKHLKLRQGPIMTMDGKQIGQHRGLPLYTIGQRKGIEIGGIGPFYAAKLDHKKNILYVVNDNNDPALFAKKFKVKSVNWVSSKEPSLPLRCDVVIRYRHKQVPCKVSDCGGRGEYSVELEKAERAITPGQSAVFYSGDKLLGGGVIE